jgi:hypothetical protein
MLKKFIIINALISLLAFVFIFYKYIGVSGGDMAIVIFNVMLGMLQLVLNLILLLIKKYSFILQVELSILTMQIIEMLIFSQFGYYVNEWVKHNYR